MSTLQQRENAEQEHHHGRRVTDRVLHSVTSDLRPVRPETEEHESRGPKPAAVVERERREQNYRRLLAIADGVSSLAVTLAAAVLVGQTPTWVFLLVAPFAILVAKIEGLYDRDDQVIQKTSIAEWRKVLQASAIFGIGVYLSWPVLTDAHKSEGMRLFLFVMVTTLVLCVVLRSVARRLARRVSAEERCLIIGDPRHVAALAARLNATRGVEVVGTVTEDALTGSVADLRSVVEELNFHRLVIAPSGEPNGSTLPLIQAAKFIGVRVSLVPSFMTAVGGFALIEELDGMTILGVPSFGLSSSSSALKRVFDLVVGGLSVLAVSPLLLVIAVAIKLDTPGPVLFRQTRVGRGGTPFKIWKFRSMVDGADAMKQALLEQNEAQDGLFKIIGDPRITRIGRFIRATHLDELPQLVNVLRGEMSLVGPRPLVPDEDARLTGRDRHRLQLTPGITGPWQIKGPLHTPLSEMAMLDYRYASAWSIWQDVDILLQTAARVLDRGGH